MKSGFSMTDLNKYGSQGLFLPLEDLIREHAPNLTKVLDERDAWKYLTSADGHVYSLPEIGRQDGAVTTYWINKRCGTTWDWKSRKIWMSSIMY